MNRIKSRPFVIGAISTFCVMGALVLWCSVDREPKHLGKPLSYWLDQNASGEFRYGVVETLNALKAIGPPAAAPLVEDLSCTDSAVRRYYSGFRSKLPPLISALLPQQQMPAPDVRNNAFSALCQLGKEAHEQVPELILLLNHKDAKVRMYATLVLACIGSEAKPAVPHLEELSQDGSLSNYVSEALRRIKGKEGKQQPNDQKHQSNAQPIE